MAISRESMRDMLERSRFAIRWGGALGLLCHPVYYVVWTYLLPQPYDNLPLRLSAAFVCIPLLFHAHWPKRLNHWLLIYWHCCLIYVLPFVCTFLTVRNSFSTMWMMTEVMMIFIMALCIDSPLLLIACVGIGMSAGASAAIVSAPATLTLGPGEVSNLAVIPVVMLCAMAFSHAISKGRISVEKNRALQALAGSIAHEMRNPLSQLRHVLDRVEEALPASTFAPRAVALPAGNAGALYEHLAQGQLSIERGLRIIAMTLDEVSAKSIRSDRLRYLSAAETTRKALDEYGFEDARERAKVSLDVREDFVFKVDETVYLFTLFNLIKNALYHIAAHPRATLALIVERQSVIVRDTGNGIAPEILAHLFEPFRTAGTSGGTGLGLAYCQRAMRAFGGSIDCDSEVGRFTAFTLRFPAVSTEEVAQHERMVFERAAPVFTGKRILSVDDDPAQRARTRRALGRAGAHVDEAENGALALAALRRAAHYDLVLMDVSMPVMDGFAATEKLRADHACVNRNVPIAGYTSEPGNAVRVHARRAGMDDVIGKSASVQDLIEALQTLLESGARCEAGPHADGLVGKTILLADDDTYSRLVVKTYLERFGATVVEAEHGLAVLANLREDNAIDALLMDMNMPGMGGIEATAQIRARADAQARVPIIALTSQSDSQSMQACVAAGMNEVMIKPVQPGPLFACLTRQLARRGGASEEVRAGRAVAPAARGETAAANSPAESHASDDKTAAAIADTDLLDDAHLDELAALDLLDDSFVNAIGQIRSLIARLTASAAAADIEAAHVALHALLGVSGNIGAKALHQFARQIYPRVIDGQWPAEPDWLAHLAALGSRSASALQIYHTQAQARARRAHRDALSE